MNTPQFYKNIVNTFIEYALNTPYYPDPQLIEDVEETFGKLNSSDKYFLVAIYDRDAKLFFNIVEPSHLIKMYLRQEKFWVVFSSNEQKRIIEKYCTFMFGLLFEEKKSFCIIDKTKMLPEIAVRFDYNYDPETYVFGFGMLDADEMYVDAVTRALDINEKYDAYFGDVAEHVVKNVKKMNKDFYGE